jgi:hypothetical protein
MYGRNTIMAQSMESPEVLSLTKRYKDAYIVAKAMVTLGMASKIIALVIAALIIVAGAIVGIAFGYQVSSALYSARSDGTVGMLLGLMCFGGGAISAVFIGGILYLLGILISAQGQILMASLDSAVNSSPFLTNEHRTTIMSL